MGKGILFMAVAAIFGGSAIIFGLQRSALKADENLSEHQSRIVAREIARSGTNYGVAEVLRDFGWRDGFQQIEHMSGHFDVSVLPIRPYSLVDVVATGKHSASDYEIITHIERDFPIQAAVTFDTRNVTKTDFGGKASSISGMDVRGWELPLHGILAIDENVYGDLMGSLKHDDNVLGVGGLPDIVHGHVLVNIDEFVDEAYTIPFANRHILLGSTENNNPGQGKGKGKGKGLANNQITIKNSYGTPDDPAIVIIEGDFNPGTHFSGHGVLIITGNMDGHLSWNGLVVQYGVGQTIWNQKGNSLINGAVWFRNWLPDPVEAPIVGSMDVDVFAGNNQKKSHPHYHDFSTKYDLYFLDIANDPKLKFTPLVKAKAKQVRIEFINTALAQPLLNLKAGNVTHTGPVSTTSSFTFDPKKVDNFRIDFAGQLPQAQPADVQQNTTSRAGAFTVRAYNAQSNQLLYEVSAYIHELISIPGLGKAKGIGNQKHLQQGFDIKFGGASSIRYDSQALWPLTNIFTSLNRHQTTTVLDAIERVP